MTLNIFQLYAPYIAGILVFILAQILSYYRRNKREFTSQFETIPIIDSEKIKLFISPNEDTNQHGLYVAIIRFTNSGNVPLLAEEFETPLKTNVFSSDEALIKPIAVSIEKKSPRDLAVSLSKIDENDVIDINGVINPGDSFYLIQTFKKVPISYDVSGRIVNLKQITKREALPIKSNLAQIQLYSFSIGVVFYILLHIAGVVKIPIADITIALSVIMAVTVIAFHLWSNWHVRRIKESQIDGL